MAPTGLEMRRLLSGDVEYVFSFDRKGLGLSNVCEEGVCAVKSAVDSALLEKLHLDLGVSAVRLSAVKGAWRRGAWGESAESEAVEQGVSLEAEAEGGNLVGAKWHALSQLLSTLSCSSLGTQTVYSKPFSVPSSVPGGIHQRLAQFVPSVDLCLESVVAWKTRLLPRQGHSALSSLMDPHWMLAAAYQSLQLHSTRDSATDTVSTQVRFRLVAGPQLASAMDEALGSYPRSKEGEGEGEGKEDDVLLPRIERTVHDSRAMDIYTTVRLVNPSVRPLTATVVEALPEWYDVQLASCTLSNASRPVLSVLRAALPGQHEKLATAATANSSSSNSALFPTLSWHAHLAPGGSMALSCRSRKQHLHRGAFPPGASRGLEVPPPRVVWSNGHVQGAPFALVTVPIPDATMPYNVITIVCSLAAFVLGSLLKRFGQKQQHQQQQQQQAQRESKASSGTGGRQAPVKEAERSAG